MLYVEIKGTTKNGLIFDNEHWRCPKCGGLCNVSMHIDKSKKWYLEQMVEFEVNNEVVRTECKKCGAVDEVTLRRASVIGVIV